MANCRIIYPMRKRGQVDPVTLFVGIVVLGGVLIFGFIGTNYAIDSTRYVFDPTTNTTYDLLKCKSNQLPESAIALRGGLDDLKEGAYTQAQC